MPVTAGRRFTSRPTSTRLRPSPCCSRAARTRVPALGTLSPTRRCTLGWQAPPASTWWTFCSPQGRRWTPRTAEASPRSISRRSAASCLSSPGSCSAGPRRRRGPGDGQTPADLARARGHEPAARFLETWWGERARVVARRERRLSPWTTLVEKDVEFVPGRGPDTYHAFGPFDWVVAAARMPDGRIPVVRQFRPAIEQYTWELPSGLVDPARIPRRRAGVSCSRRPASGPRVHVPGRAPAGRGPAGADPACLSRRRLADRRPEFVPEPGVAVEYVLPEDVLALIRAGTFCQLHHIAAFFLAGLAPARAAEGAPGVRPSQRSRVTMRYKESEAGEPPWRRGHAEGGARRGRHDAVRSPEGDVPGPDLGGREGLLRLGARRAAGRPRGDRGGLGHAGAHGVSEPHLLARRRGARHQAEPAVRPDRAHVRLRHGRAPVRVRVHRGRARGPGHGAGRREAEPAEPGRGAPQHGHGRRPRVGGVPRAHRAPLLRPRGPGPHGAPRHDRGADGAGQREESQPRGQESLRPLPEGRDSRPGPLLPDDLEPVPPLHVLAHHRRRGRRHRGERGTRP